MKIDKEIVAFRQSKIMTNDKTLGEDLFFAEVNICVKLLLKK